MMRDGKAVSGGIAARVKTLPVQAIVAGGALFLLIIGSALWSVLHHSAPVASAAVEGGGGMVGTPAEPSKVVWTPMPHEASSSFLAVRSTPKPRLAATPTPAPAVVSQAVAASTVYVPRAVPNGAPAPTAAPEMEVKLDPPPADEAAASPRATVVADTTTGYDETTSDGEVDEGTAIPARLDIRVDSTLTGLVRAITTSNVQDSFSHSKVAIPKGSMLIGYYTSDTSNGQARLGVIWTRIRFANGKRFRMGDEPGTGEMGEAGQGGQTDTHAGANFGRAVLYTLLDTVTGAFSKNSSTVSIAPIQGALSNSTYGAAQSQRPTMHLAAGDAFNVMVNRPLALNAYTDQGTP